MNEVEGTIITPRTFEAADYGRVSHDSLLQKCRSIFKGQNSRLSDGKIKKKAIRFDKTAVEEAGRTFDVVTDIQIFDEMTAKEEADEDPQIAIMWNDLCTLDECTSVPFFDQYRGKGQVETNIEDDHEGVRNEDKANVAVIEHQYAQGMTMPTMPIFPPNNEKIVNWYTQPKSELQLPHQEESRSVGSVQSVVKQIDDGTEIGLDSGLKYLIYKLYERGDCYGCRACNMKGDKFFMNDHNCRGTMKK